MTKYMIKIPRWPKPSKEAKPGIYDVTSDPITARDIVLTRRLGVSIKDLRKILDDRWCEQYPVILADLLNISAEEM